MSEPITEPTPEQVRTAKELSGERPGPLTGTQGDPATDKPLGEGGEKALKAERDRASKAEKANAALQKQLDDINAANMSEIERAQKAAADAQTELNQAKADAARYRVAAANGISDEDAELFLTGTDEDTLLKQALRLKERTSTGPRPDLSQGGKGDAMALNGDPLLDSLKSKLGIS